MSYSRQYIVIDCSQKFETHNFSRPDVQECYKYLVTSIFKVATYSFVIAGKTEESPTNPLS